MNGRFFLVEPHAGLKESYISLMVEFLANREPLVPFTLSYSYDDFDAMLRKLDSFGIGVPEGFVPHSTFWLVTDEHVGRRFESSAWAHAGSREGRRAYRLRYSSF